MVRKKQKKKKLHSSLFLGDKIRQSEPEIPSNGREQASEINCKQLIMILFSIAMFFSLSIKRN